jgi:hypothetical protein
MWTHSALGLSEPDRDVRRHAAARGQSIMVVGASRRHILRGKLGYPDYFTRDPDPRSLVVVGRGRDPATSFAPVARPASGSVSLTPMSIPALGDVERPQGVVEPVARRKARVWALKRSSPPDALALTERSRDPHPDGRRLRRCQTSAPGSIGRKGSATDAADLAHVLQCAYACISSLIKTQRLAGCPPDLGQ